MLEPELYVGREQTLIKHFILKSYLERFSRIIGYAGWSTINYVDCFSGPWESRADDYRDTSFGIALRVLTETREELRQRKRAVDVRCFFLERSSKRYKRLAEYVDAFEGVESSHKNRKLEDAIDDILDFARGGANSFTFIFIDPTGWTGFPLEKITPLLRIRPGEVLINLMSGFVGRFAEHPNNEARDTIKQLLNEDVADAVADVHGQDREDELLRTYIRGVKRAGDFEWVGAAIVFKPDIEATNFHLIYGTRGPKGIEKFKEVERKAMQFTEEVRAEAKARRAEERRGGQKELLPAADMHPSVRMQKVREHYLTRARSHLRKVLEKKSTLSYESAWHAAVVAPLVWRHDVDEWILKWRDEGRLEIRGMTSRQKKPHDDNVIVWRSRI
jgi:three-Cys-motif partner protein